MTTLDAADTPWYAYHENLVTLTSYMADHGYDAEAIAYAVEKPWKYSDVFQEAEAEIKGEDIEE